MIYQKLAEILVGHVTGDSLGGDYKDYAADLSGAYRVLNQSYSLGIEDIPSGYSTPRTFLEWLSTNGDNFIASLAQKLTGRLSKEEVEKVCTDYERARKIIDKLNELAMF